MDSQQNENLDSTASAAHSHGEFSYHHIATNVVKPTPELDLDFKKRQPRAGGAYRDIDPRRFHHAGYPGAWDFSFTKRVKSESNRLVPCEVGLGLNHIPHDHLHEIVEEKIKKFVIRIQTF